MSTASNDLDCDDQDPNIHPGADETCNRVDDDCDGKVDEEPIDGLEWKVDADGDSYGDNTTASPSCDQPEGEVLPGGDCDDTDSSIHPGARETCDGIDNDCDGRTDGTDVDDPPTWCADADGDSYGSDADGARTATGCDAPEGYGACDDCDDGDPEVSPAALELCGNVDDENCDGVASDCNLWGRHGVADADAALYGDDDGALGRDDAGMSVSSGDVNGDGFVDLWVGAPASGMGETFGGAVYLVQGPVSGAWDLRDEAAAVLVSDTALAEAGRPVRSAGDVNGDGYDDVWVGAVIEEPGGTASLVSGPVSGTFHLSDSDLRLVADVTCNLGAAVAGSGDLDGDGLIDGAVFGPAYDVGAPTDAGAVWLVYNTGLWGTHIPEDAAVTLYGSEVGAEVGSTMAMLGDTTGDGSDDLLMKKGLDSWLLADALEDGNYFVDDVAQVVRHLDRAPDARIGDNIASMGDLNGDGYADFATSQPYSDMAVWGGMVYIIYGPWGTRSTVAEADIAILGDYSDAWVGPAAGGEDIDADGFPDVAIGAPAMETDDDHGHVCLFHGPLSAGTITLADADANIAGALAGSLTGWDVALVGDTNDDGYGDVLIGAPLDVTGGGGVAHSGAAYLFLGESYSPDP